MEEEEIIEKDLDYYRRECERLERELIEERRYMSDTEGNDIAVSKTELDVFLKIVDKLFENAGDTYHQDSYDT